MKIKLYHEKHQRDTLLFSIALILFSMSLTLETTAWATHPPGELNILGLVFKLMRYAAYFLALIKITIEKKYSKKTLLQFSVIMFVVLMNMLACKEKATFLYMFIFLSAIGIHSKYLIRCTFITQSAIFTAVAGCSLLGLLEDYYSIQGDRVRHFLGFSYATTAPTIFFFLVLQYIFLKKGTILFREYMLFMIIAVLLFYMTRSRMDFILTISALTFFFFLYNRFWVNALITQKIKKLIVLLPFLLAALSIWIAIHYDPSNDVWIRIDSLVNNRLRLSQEGLQAYNITLFGQNIDWIGGGLVSMRYGYRGTYNYVDNSYIMLLLNSGVIFTGMILLAYSLLLKLSIDRKYFYLTWILIFILFLSSTESWLIDYGKNPFLLLCATEWMYIFTPVNSVSGKVSKNAQKYYKKLYL